MPQTVCAFLEQESGRVGALQGAGGEADTDGAHGGAHVPHLREDRALRLQTLGRETQQGQIAAENDTEESEHC